MTTITLPPSREETQFRRVPEAAAALAALLATPQFVKAAQIIRDEAVLRTLPAQVPGVHHDTSIAHYAHFLMGINACLDRLKRMSIALPKDGPDPADEVEGVEDYFSHVAERIQEMPEPPEPVKAK